VFQHVGQRRIVLQYVHIFHRVPLSGIGFPSRLGMGSRVLAEYQHRVAHVLLLSLGVSMNYQPFAALSTNSAWSIVDAAIITPWLK
jgi:hypothetical protein